MALGAGLPLLNHWEHRHACCTAGHSRQLAQEKPQGAKQDSDKAWLKASFVGEAVVWALWGDGFVQCCAERYSEIACIKLGSEFRMFNIVSYKSPKATILPSPFAEGIADTSP